MCEYFAGSACNPLCFFLEAWKSKDKIYAGQTAGRASGLNLLNENLDSRRKVYDQSYGETREFCTPEGRFTRGIDMLKGNLKWPGRRDVSAHPIFAEKLQPQGRFSKGHVFLYTYINV